MYEIFNIEKFLVEKTLNVVLRPDASHGIWVLFLLPLALIISVLKHHVAITDTYKCLLVFSIGLIFTNIFILRELHNGKYVKVYQLWIFIPISVLFIYLNKADVFFAVYSGFFCTILYSRIYLMVLKKFPKSFTLGEAALTSQAAVILLYSTLPHFYYSIEDPITETGESSTIIIQMELFGVMALAGFLYLFNIKGISVYFWSFIILLSTFLIPLHVSLRKSPVLWVLSLLIEDIPTIKMILYWVICVCIATLAVIRQEHKGASSSSERKIFHILAVAVFVPGLMYECTLLYLGSGMLLGIFFLLEILRNCMVPPFGSLLQSSFMALKDDKDAGILAVTPIYLLTGFTTPLWIHPAPCDVTDSAYFHFLPLLSGILSVGVGDTMASVFGSTFGKHFYHESKKTVEGTLASIISQLFTIFVLYQIGFIVRMNQLNLIRISVAIVVTSFIEAKTDQIDNTILPLIMYIMLV